MGGTTTTNTTQQSAQNTQPWAPAQPQLGAILGQLGGQPDPNANPYEQAALAQLQVNANNTPNLVPQATSLTNDLSAGGTDRTGILSGAYGNLQGTLNPIANASLDPTQTPGIQNLLSTIQNDVSNQVNSQFAGAGRDLSGMNQQTLARGIAQGEAAPLLAQYNQNVANATNAANSLYGAGATTASGLSGLDQQALANRLNALNVGQAIPTLQNLGPEAQLAAQNAARTLPLGNMSNIEQLLLPIAQLGSQTQGQQTGTQSTTTPLGPSLLAALLGGGAIASKFYKPGS